MNPKKNGQKAVRTIVLFMLWAFSVSLQAKPLEGDWSFHWQQQLTPESQDLSGAIPINGARGWAGLEDPRSATILGPIGWGTYRIVLESLPPVPDGYEIYFPFISTASHVTIYSEAHPDRRQTVTSGKFGSSEDTYVAQIKPLILRFMPQADDQRWVILAQVSNFLHANGGILSPLSIDIAPRIAESRQFEELGYVFSFGVILVIGFYNLMIFVRRREDLSSLWLAIFCFVSAMRGFANGNLGNHFWRPTTSAPFIFKYILEYATLTLQPLSYAIFVHLSFRPASFKRILQVLSVPAIVGASVTLVSLPHHYGQFLWAYQALIGLLSLFCLTVLGRAAFKRLEGADFALGGTFVLLMTIIYDILVTYNVLPEPYLMQFGTVVFVFLQSQIVAKRAAIAHRTAEFLKTHFEREVERQTQDITTMMQHIPQGIFLIMRDLTIGAHYSRFLEHIFAQDQLNGKSITDLLLASKAISLEEKSIIDTIIISSFDAPDFTWDANSWQLPHECRMQAGGVEKVIEVSWHPIIGSSELIERILVSIRDLTQVRALEKEHETNKSELTAIIELLSSGKAKVRNFFEHAQYVFDQLSSLLRSNEKPDDIKRLGYIELHTLKGVARNYGLKSITSVIHDAEQYYNSDCGFDRTKLLADLNKIAALVKTYQTIYEEKFLVHQGNSDSIGLNRAHLIRLEEKMMDLKRSPQDLAKVRSLVEVLEGLLGSHLYQAVPQTLRDLETGLAHIARELGKEPPKIHLLGVESLLLPPATQRLVESTFTHTVRNSLDHGIESKEERLAKGKPLSGSILIQVEMVNDRYEILYEDDGRGIEVAAIEAKARAKGLWQLARKMTIAEASEMLFHPGFSTKSEVTEISGRGVGLDAVRSLYREFAGDVRFNLDGISEDASSAPFRLWGFLPETAILNSKAS